VPHSVSEINVLKTFGTLCVVGSAAFACLSENINFGSYQVETGQLKRTFLLKIIANEALFSRNYTLLSRVEGVEI